MKRKTLNILHEAYVNAVENSSDIMDILDNLLNSLTLIDVSTIDKKDAIQFDSLIKGIYTSKMVRQETFRLTNLVIDLSTIMSYIVIWLNLTKNMGIDISLSGRRKALETELEKILDYSKDKDMACIHDRFGLRGILQNNLPDNKTIPLIIEASDIIVSIITRTNRKNYMEFSRWISENEKIDTLTKQKVNFILDLPFNLTTRKDYINNTKENTSYQSLHYILQLDMFSGYLPGSEFELQMRTLNMHKRALDDNYVSNRRQDTKGIFHINDFSNVTIVGFTGYKSLEDDTDGIHFAKELINRRIKPSLINI